MAERHTLDSSGFEQAVQNLLWEVLPRIQSYSSALSDQAESFRTSIDKFSASVDKLVRCVGMQAANDQAKINGSIHLPYDESSFHSL